MVMLLFHFCIVKFFEKLLLHKILLSCALLIALKLELASIVDCGERLYTCELEGDRPLALQCYEVLSTLKASIQTSIAEKIGPGSRNIPLHVLPSLCNLYPVLHLQRKLPGVLVQPWSQLSVFAEHSSLSMNRMTKMRNAIHLYFMRGNHST